jgi:ketosteroid isomerase-like protein
MSATDPDGNPRERAGKAIEVMRRQADGSWKLVIDDPYARG